MYKRAVARVQIKYRFAKQLYFAFSKSKHFQHAIFTYNTLSKQQETIDDERFNFYAHYTVQINNDLYSVAETGLAVTKYANLSQGSSMVKTLLSEPLMNQEGRVYACVINFQNKALYVTGGQHRRKRHDAQKFNLETNRWEAIPKLNKTRYRHSSCAIGDRVYVFGGLSQVAAANAWQ